MNEPTVHVQAAIYNGDIVEFFADGNFESITISAEQAEMISAELIALREENGALRERVAALEAAIAAVRLVPNKNHSAYFVSVQDAKRLRDLRETADEGGE